MRRKFLLIPPILCGSAEISLLSGGSDCHEVSEVKGDPFLGLSLGYIKTWSLSSPLGRQLGRCCLLSARDLYPVHSHLLLAFGHSFVLCLEANVKIFIVVQGVIQFWTIRSKTVNCKVERCIPGRLLHRCRMENLMEEFCQGVLKEYCEDNFLC